MIAYLDTSALARLYLPETGRDAVVSLVGHEVVTPCSHLVAYVEMSAALGKAERMDRISSAGLQAAWTQFQLDWRSVVRVDVDEALVRRAAGLAREHGLRAHDSVHLAAAERVLVAVGSRDFVFVAFDARLNSAASALGMPLFERVAIDARAARAIPGRCLRPTLAGTRLISCDCGESHAT